MFKGILELLDGAFQPHTIDDPAYIFVERDTFFDFITFNGGMLKLKGQTLRRQDVGNVQLTAFVASALFLPLIGEKVFPISAAYSYVGFYLKVYRVVSHQRE